ncbi:hypothetical protein M569_11395, partial [Genlisea aurea]
MSLTSVQMSEEVWLTCLTHALSTETEEVMGLLLGDIKHSKNGNVTALIWGALPQPRADRQKDRVETNPEQLTAASLHAEISFFFFFFHRNYWNITRVIGWYHSHPHITVLPSHVDVRTQAMYQLMDSGFIGLIFSCFSEDAQKVGRIQVTAFQSSDRKQQQLNHHTSKPVLLSPVRKTVHGESSSVSASEMSMAASGTEDHMDQDTANSSTKVAGKLPLLEGLASNDEFISGNSFNANDIQDLDPMDVSDGMQEAMHLSSLEMSGAEFVGKEVALHVVPASSILVLDSPLSSFKHLQQVLYDEEKTAYNQAIAQNTRNGAVHPLAYVHHTSTYKASLCKMMEYCLSPAMISLQDRLRENEIQLKLLGEEGTVLESEIGGRANSPPSPSRFCRT